MVVHQDGAWWKAEYLKAAFNSAKCKVMHLGGKNSKNINKMNDGLNDVQLSKTMIEKDLCVKMDNILTFSKHIQEAPTKQME